jgi:hypothetical protein
MNIKEELEYIKVQIKKIEDIIKLKRSLIDKKEQRRGDKYAKQQIC